MFNFTGKTVMITGAVRNTGCDIAHAFAAAGARVVINGRNSTDTNRVANELRDKYPAEIIEAPVDITKGEELEAFFVSLREQKISLDVLVNNAVVQTQGYAFIETPYAEMKRTFEVNVIALYHCSQLAAAMMIEHGGGAIINIGSNTADQSIKNRSAYVASKGAVNALTRAMALDLAQYNIRVNGVTSGYIHSDRWDTLDPAAAKRRRKNIPLGRECAAADIAHTAMFLASDVSRSTTGAALIVDGGCSAQLVPADCDC